MRKIVLMLLYLRISFHISLLINFYILVNTMIKRMLIFVFLMSLCIGKQKIIQKKIRRKMRLCTGIKMIFSL